MMLREGALRIWGKRVIFILFVSVCSTARAGDLPAGTEQAQRLEKDGILYNKGLYALSEGRSEEAAKIFEEVLSLYPQGKFSGSASYELGVFCASKKDQTQKAVSYLTQAVNDPYERKIVPALFALAGVYETQNQFQEALAIYKKIIEQYPEDAMIQDAIAKRDALSSLLLFSPYPSPFSAEYTVNPGDSLYKIAAKFNTTANLIKRTNQLKNDNIYPGQKLKIVKGDFGVLVDKSQKTLYLKLNGEVIKTYPIAVGRDNITPVGTFKVTNKLENPVWYNNGKAIAAGAPENLLGVRWIGIDSPGYGIHGSMEKIQIRDQTTSGCIRMTNSDVTELYDIVTVGIPVSIVD